MAEPQNIPSPGDTTPPPGAGTMNVVRWLLLAGLLLLAVGAVLWYFHVGPFAQSKSDTGTLYQCPMHPQIIQDQPGNCPICGMNLVPIAKPGAASPAATPQPTPTPAASAAKPGQYTCPMCPDVVSDEPGKCPHCGMDLQQVPPAATSPTPAAAVTPGLSEVHLDAARVQMIGVRTARATKTVLAGEIRTIGVVAIDESRLAMVHTRIGGWIDRLLVSRVGDRVSRGQTVAKLHSLALMAAQEDYLVAVKNTSSLGEPSGANGGTDLRAPARRRLELLGMTGADIQRLEANGKALSSVDVISPAGGVVISREVLEGHEVQPGTTIMTVGDLSHVWVLLDLYESDLSRVRRGQKVTVEIPALPGRSFPTSIDYVYPLMDTRTRTVKARAVLANPDGRLVPGMFGNALIAVEPREALTVPFDALLDNGNEQYVFVVAQPGHFIPVAVKIGLRTPAGVEILSGLADGAEVVTSANFLLDAESRMLASAQDHSSPATPEVTPNHSGHSGH